MGGLGLSLGLDFGSASASGPIQSGPFYNSAGIYFGPASIGATDQTGGTLGAPSTGTGGGFSLTTWLIIGAAAVGAWYLLKK